MKNNLFLFIRPRHNLFIFKYIHPSQVKLKAAAVAVKKPVAADNLLVVSACCWLRWPMGIQHTVYSRARKDPQRLFLSPLVRLSDADRAVGNTSEGMCRGRDSGTIPATNLHMSLVQ